MISLDNLTVSYGGWTLFDNISFLINPKDRIGLVGKNGAGKTTLLRIITGEQQPTSGAVTLNGDCTIGYLQFMREAERLKNVLRSARTSTGRHESTAEHTWRLALLALVLADEKPELDLPRVLAMCLVHDLGEAYEGDIPAVAQCDPASKAAAELAAMERLTPLLPAEAAARIRTLWEEYEACATPEARWVKALDKAETILQHNQGANPADFDYEFNLTYGAEWFRDDALLRRLRRLLDAETARHA